MHAIFVRVYLYVRVHVCKCMSVWYVCTWACTPIPVGAMQIYLCLHVSMHVPNLHIARQRWPISRPGRSRGGLVAGAHRRLQRGSEQQNY